MDMEKTNSREVQRGDKYKTSFREMDGYNALLQKDDQKTSPKKMVGFNRSQ